MAVAGGRQALDRLLTMHFQIGDILDAITLLACIIDSEAILSDLRGSDRKRLNHLIRAIDAHPLVTAQAPTDTARLAQRFLDELRAGMAV